MLTTHGTRISTMVIRTTTTRTIQTGSVLFGVLNHLSIIIKESVGGLKKPPAREFLWIYIMTCQSSSNVARDG